MRPKQLEVEGFTAFRERTVVDFEGADLFAFTGPTGSGKSSLVDAMGFALFGQVHRYGEKLVHAAISSGSTEARVRLDFSVGTTDYTAVRVVRRTGPGRATTKEARLERAGEVMAGDEKGLTAAVEDLLGLDFEQYCRCVVLPQGAFADFLHDTPKGRQDLLTGLLDLRFYRDMAQLAGRRASEAEARGKFFDERLTGDLAEATPEALAAAEQRVADLGALSGRLQAAMPQLEQAVTAAREASSRASELERRAELLSSVQAPTRLGELGAAVADARNRLAAATKALEEAEADVANRVAGREALGDRAPLDAAAGAWRRRVAVAARLVTAAKAHDQAGQAARQAGVAADAAQAASSEAEGAVEAARQANRAHALATELVAGQPCPVCQQVVHEVPLLTEPPDFDDTRRRGVEAKEAAEKASAAAAIAAAAEARAAGERTTIEAQVHELDVELRDTPDLATVERSIAVIEEADASIAAARAAEQQARSRHKQATAAETEAREAEQQARAAFDVERDRLAGLGPPAPKRADLAADWQELAGWATELRQSSERDRVAALAEAEQRSAERVRLVDEMRMWCADAGVPVGDQSPGDAVTVASAKADAERASLLKRMDEAAKVRDQRAAVLADEQVARVLALHLRSDHFEKWLLDEALAELTASATSLLRELSAGAYSLILDPKSRDFAVVDHRNADEARPVRTLSGGETFLASLALALALADRIADLSSAGAARLEALFLDEGFGTLDAGTLDTVASAIEQLGAGGRMVGIVTHVRELAERVPVRFEVSKGAATATVDKVAS